MKQRVIITSDDELITMPLEELMDDLRDDFIHALDDFEQELVEYFKQHGPPPEDDAGRDDWYDKATDYLDTKKTIAIGKFFELLQKWLKGEFEWQK